MVAGTAAAGGGGGTAGAGSQGGRAWEGGRSRAGAGQGGGRWAGEGRKGPGVPRTLAGSHRPGCRLPVAEAEAGVAEEAVEAEVPRVAGYGCCRRSSAGVARPGPWSGSPGCRRMTAAGDWGRVAVQLRENVIGDNEMVLTTLTS